MKILAIRGRNLASLSGEFGIELAQEPLSRAGLYVITGPTGAGKSTLLDALCLALFDRTPRLGDNGGPKIGGPTSDEKTRLVANDVRGLLTRGTAEGWAEVEFIGKDQRKYRSRWTLKRARSKADGALQKQELALYDALTGEVIAGGTKTSVLTEIQTRLGLSFPEFRRSALLAQGDFAAFFKADVSERSSLLEKITGRDTYTRISKAAFELARKAKDALALLEAKAAQLGQLTPDARAALEHELILAKTQYDEAKVAAAAANADVAWYATHQTLETEFAAALTRSSAAADALAAAAPRQQHLDDVRAAQRLRGVVQAADHAVAQVAAAEAAETTAHEAATTAAERQGLVTVHVQVAADALQVQLNARTSHGPALDAALQLDTQRDAAAAEAAACEKRAKEATTQRDRAATAAATARAAVTTQEQHQQQATAWFDTHPHAETLAAGWPHLDATIREFIAIAAEQPRAAASLTTAQTACETAESQRAKAAAQAEAAIAELTAAELEVQRAESASPASARETLTHERSQLLREAVPLRAALEAQQLAASAVAERDTATAAAIAAESDAVAHEQQEEGSRVLAESSQQQLRTLEHQLEAAKAILSLDDRRPSLVDGQPCALCGATEHPWAVSGPPPAQIAENTAAHVRILTEWTNANKAAASGAQAAKHYREVATKEQTRARVAAERLQGAAEQWVSARTSLQALLPPVSVVAAAAPPPAEIPPDEANREPQEAIPEVQPSLFGVLTKVLKKRPSEAPAPAPNVVRTPTDAMPRGLPVEVTDPNAEIAVRAALATVETALQALSEQEQALSTLESAAQRARDAARAATKAAETARTAAEIASQACRAAETQRVSCHSAAEALGARHARSLTALALGFGERPGWQTALADAEKFHKTLAAEVAEAQRQREQRDRATAALATLKPEAASAAATQTHAEAALVVAQTALQTATAAHASLVAERQKLLNGKTVAEFREALDKACTDAETKLTQAREAAKLADQAATDTAATHRERVAAIEVAKAQRDAAQSQLVATLAEHTLDEPTLRERLSRSEAWVNAEQLALTAVHTELHTARGAAAERQARLLAHQNTNTPSVDAPTANLAKDQSENRLREAAQREQRLLVDQQRDDQARQHGHELDDQIIAQKVITDRWSKLEDVIGSADGKKFRAFAQGLTLDSLLMHANHHLESLAPRYRLMRVPGGDLDVQVIDRHLGDEARAVQSLSGGEMFLASLALALGLASLTSSETPVESLFIDEGFGTLDRHTLEIALGALDALQASGRQVGMISHVEGLAEHIGVEVRVERVSAGISRVLKPKTR